MQDFKGKVAVITGGASGIGWGLAEHCAGEGMKVVIADVEKGALKEAETRLKAQGAQVLAVNADVSHISDVETLAKRTLEVYGGVHLLFNNAGVQPRNSLNHPVWENSLADWEWTMGVNLWGVIYGIKTFVPIMLKQNSECHIVNTSSMAGLFAEPQLVIYSVTKGAIIKLSEGLYLQLKQGDSKIGASVFCPAFVRSNLTDAERNRPGNLQNPDASQLKAEAPSLIKQSQKAAYKELTPEQSADLVFKAIRAETFYIFSDPLVERLFKQSADNILAGRNPQRPNLDLAE
jgi:NAD(P)-dependent dehydrogenase (short-subunit alcohol dehydrogenase family)